MYLTAQMIVIFQILTLCHELCSDTSEENIVFFLIAKEADMVRWKKVCWLSMKV